MILGLDPGSLPPRNSLVAAWRARAKEARRKEWLGDSSALFHERVHPRGAQYSTHGGAPGQEP